MHIHSRYLKYALVFLAILCSQNTSSAQTLYDVVISLSDRQRVINQRDQVSTYLRNQNNDPSDADTDLPPDYPIDWLAVGTNPTQSAVGGLDIVGKIALLNQAVAEFDRLKLVFLNSSPAEYAAGSIIGALQPYTTADFDPLPRITPENYNLIIRLQAQRARALCLISWPAAFVNKLSEGDASVSERVVYDDPGDEDGDGDREPRVVINPVGESADWQPGSIGPGNLDVEISDAPIAVTSSYNSRTSVYGYFEQSDSGIEGIPPLRNQRIALFDSYSESARLSATAPGAQGTQVGGMVYILRRSHWHQIDTHGGSSKYDKKEAGYVVDGSGNSGSVPLIVNPPTATINGSWVTTSESGSNTRKSFVEGGYQHKAASYLPSTDPGYSNDYDHSYEANWTIGCTFYSIFKPIFTRGVDDSNMRTKLESVDGFVADKFADGNLLLHPRPGLLFGIDLGPGLKGGGNGYVSTRAMESDFYGYYDYYGSFWDGWNSMPRFDSSYSLKFAGSCCDYHVVYENDRSNRTQSLPTNSIGWPYTAAGNFATYDTTTLYYAWDSPRLKQIAGRDLVADITYNANHYGGYTINIYRRPTGNAAPTPGQAIDISGMTLIRTWTFSHAGGSVAHPTDAEKLVVTGSGVEKHEIQANEILPDQGLGYSYLGYDSNYYSWWSTEGTRSWNLKLSQGTTEKLNKEIKIITSPAENESLIWDISLRESLDGQLVSSLSSKSLDPFSDRLPADWKITTAGKTITGSATFGSTGPASGYGKLPTSVSFQYDGIQPDADYTWDTNGLLASLTQGPWTSTGTVSGDTYTLTHKFNNSLYATDWTEFLEGGNKVKTYSAPDGNASSKTDSSVAGNELEYGNATNGLPGLPFIVKRSDGSGASYDWQWLAPSNTYQLVLTEGLLSGNTVTRGTKQIRTTNGNGQPTELEAYVLNAASLKTGGSVYSDFTPWGMPKKSTDYNTNLPSTWTLYGNLSRLSTSTSTFGVTSEISSYDALERPTARSTNGINASNVYTALSTTSTITGNVTGLLTDTRDGLGRLTSSENTWNGVTDNLNLTHSATSEVISRQNLLGTHQATYRKDDGSLTAASGPTLAFGGNNGNALTLENGLFKSTTLIAGQTATYQTTWTDAWGRIRKTTAPTASGSGTTDYLYSDPTSSLKRIRITEPNGRKTMTESDPFNTAGSITRSGIDVNGNGTLGTSDRYVESTTTVSGSNLVTTLKLTENNGLREILRTEWAPGGNVTVTKINGSEETITRTPHYSQLLANTVTTSSSKGWLKNETLNNLGLTTNSNLSGNGIPAANLTPTWRADGSLSGVSFTANGDTHSATFNPNGTLASLTAPGKGNILGGHTISGGVETLIIDGVTYTVKLDGTAQSTKGSDIIGKTDTLAVSGSGYKHTTTPTLGAATEVVLNAAGVPIAKNYAAGAGESNTYQNGLPQNVSLARGGSLAFGYSNDGAKDLISATWPQVTSGPFTIPAATQGYGYDLAGRINSIGDDSGVRAITYQNGRAKETAWTSGPLAGYKIVRGLDSSGRCVGFDLWRGNGIIHSAQKAPNGPSAEVSSLASGNVKIVIDRDAGHQITGLRWGNATGTFVPTATQSWTRGTAGRILSASSNVSGAPSFNYKGTANNESTAFDAKGRRLKCATAGGEWTYQYTNGQLASAVHPTLGTFTYAFDGIGRRTDKGTANTSDSLNRTLAWTHSQNKTVKITAAPAAQVWFNGTQIPNFTGSYNYPIPSPGASGGWVAWNTLAVLPGQGDAGANPDAKAEKSGAVWMPPVNETLSYDAAGNRESSALWDNGWDARNNLQRARTKNYNTAAQGYDITNAYDAEGRRFSKKVTRYQNGAIVEQKEITFLHDGDDLIYERHQLPSGLTTLERKYVWGPDISGTQGGAGGAGGLLLIRETKGNTTIDLYPLYDGTGHVVALTDNTGTLKAEYAYGPFGEVIYVRGPYAQSCPFRYAAKYLDQETGLYNFGRRFYDPITGQWLSREPLGEKESLNLYQYTGGDPINYVDVDGLAKVALDGKSNLTAIGQIILDIAKGDPNAARSLLMAKQVDAETAGIAVAGDGGEDPMRNVMRAIETAIGNAQEDSRDEWRMIAAKAGLSGERYFGGYKDAWMTTKLAEYAPQIAANAGAAIQLRAAERAVNDKATADQNSAPYKLREFLDAPFDVAAFLISAGAATDVTTGNAVTWNSFNNGGGFGLAEVTPGERVFAASLVAFGPVSRGAGFVDDFVRVGARGRSFAGTALKPWGARTIANVGSSLPERELVNFTRRQATPIVVGETDVLYRMHPTGGAGAPWWTRTKPSSELQHRMDAAWRTEWGVADEVSTLRIPSGQGLKAWEGNAAYQGDFFFGGGNQLYIPNLPKEWITTAPFR